ncbi:uncharacterized protein LOC143449939 [Clavelina lepadiformis]|uniref:ZP domain-containing protein n=1 Tax=Clavelina lepadiformis TaxID=159417 RepID=A0ABP0GIQ9_CLALP
MKLGLVCLWVAGLYVLHVQAQENATIECNPGNITIKVSKTYLDSLFDYLKVDQVFLIDSDEPDVMDPNCMLESKTDYFEIAIGFTSCFARNVTTENEMLEFSYRAILITSGINPSVIVSRDSCTVFTFGCLYQKSYNVSTANSVIPWKPEFTFNLMPSANFSFDITLRLSGETDFVSTTNTTVYSISDQIRANISVENNEPFILKVLTCSIRNLFNGVTYNIIQSSCPTDASTVVTVYSEPNVVQLAFNSPFNSSLTNSMQEYELRCLVDICDPVFQNCTAQICSKRKRRSANKGPGKTLVQISDSFTIAECPECSDGCHETVNDQIKCWCDEGFKLDGDDKTCIAQDPRPNSSPSSSSTALTSTSTTSTTRSTSEISQQRDDKDKMMNMIDRWRTSEGLYYTAFALIILLVILLAVGCFCKYRSYQKPINVADVELKN